MSSTTNTQSPLNMIYNMILNQNALNEKAYSTDWVKKANTREFDYPLAAAQEVAEYINSFGYSWWSKPAGNLALTPLDDANCRTELVDAVHFMLSNTLAVLKNYDEAADTIKHNYDVGTAVHRSRTTREWSRLLGARLLLTGIEGEKHELGRGYISHDAWTLLFACAESMGFTLEAMYSRYMGKSALNLFRQQNGYKEGTYRKLWDGKNEDNYFLANWIDSLEHVPTQEEVRSWLAVNYAKHSERLAENAS